MKFNSQMCTSRSQSERLLAFGLKKDTADIVIRPDNTLIVINENAFIYHNLEKAIQEGYFPAWSLHRLIDMIPTEITHNDYCLILGVNATCVYYADDEYAETFKAFEGNLYECMVKCVEWLIKEGYFNKEYLEE